MAHVGFQRWFGFQFGIDTMMILATAFDAALSVCPYSSSLWIGFQFIPVQTKAVGLGFNFFVLTPSGFSQVLDLTGCYPYSSRMQFQPNILVHFLLD